MFWNKKKPVRTGPQVLGAVPENLVGMAERLFTDYFGQPVNVSTSPVDDFKGQFAHAVLKNLQKFDAAVTNVYEPVPADKYAVRLLLYIASCKNQSIVAQGVKQAFRPSKFAEVLDSIAQALITAAQDLPGFRDKMFATQQTLNAGYETTDVDANRATQKIFAAGSVPGANQPGALAYFNEFAAIACSVSHAARR